MLIPPVSLENLLNEWKIDAPIDKTEPGNELARIPNLHSKYLECLTHHKLESLKISRKLKEEKKIRYRYYRGKLNNPEDLEKYNLEPLHETITDKELPLFLEADPVLGPLEYKLAVNEEIVSCCERVLKELGSRTFQLRAFIDYMKFINP